MPLIADEETRKAFHELRNTIQQIQLDGTRNSLEIEKTLAVVQAELKALNDRILQMVTRPEFTPVKLLAYGMTGTILSGAAGAFLTQIFVK